MVTPGGLVIGVYGFVLGFSCGVIVVATLATRILREMARACGQNPP